MSTSATESIRETFKNKLNNDWRVEPQCNLSKHENCGCLKPFIKTRLLEEWLGDTRSSTSNGVLLLDEIDPIRTLFHGSASTVLRGSKLVFSWLVKEGHGRLIHIFHRAGFDDTKLRNTASGYSLRRYRALRDEFAQYSREYHVGFEQLAKSLESSRWEFFPQTLGSKLENETFGNKLYIPLCQQWAVTEPGATAVVYLATIQEEFVLDNIKQYLGDQVDGGTYGTCYRLAIKRIQNTRWNTYSQERRAFTGIRDKKGMLRCLGSYNFIDEHGNEYYNILLEFANMNLHEFFMAFDPPQLTREVHSQWAEFREIAEAIETLHNFDHEGARWSGWHGDIKPRNLLRVGKQWKLADYGFTVFRAESSEDSPRAQLKECTQTWGAPETIQPGNFVLQTVDTWSFGCVLSIAATWMVKGIKGVLEYQRYRSEACKKLSHARHAPDAFHDGNDVLPHIKRWHAHLRQLIRPSDNITNRILEMVDVDLLLKEPTARLKSRNVRERLDQILSEAEDSQTEASIDEELSEALAYVEARSDDLVGLYESLTHKGSDGTTSIGPVPAIAELRPIDHLERPSTSGFSLQGAARPLILGDLSHTRISPASTTLTGSARPVRLPELVEFNVATESSSDEQSEGLQTPITQPTEVTDGNATPELGLMSSPLTTNHQVSPRPSTAQDPEAEAEVLRRLWSHVSTANIEALTELLASRGPGLASERDIHGRTLIMVAARHNHLSVVDLLIEQSELWRKDNEQKTVLHHLIKGQHGKGRGESPQFLETLTRVLYHKPDPQSYPGWIDWSDSQGTCLFFCAHTNMPEAAEKLLYDGASVDGVTESLGDSPLVEAMRRGNHRVVSALLRYHPAMRHQDVLRGYLTNLPSSVKKEMQIKLGDPPKRRRLKIFPGKT